jgi:hypothetical protein
MSGIIIETAAQAGSADIGGALDLVLKASGSGIRYYECHKTLYAMINSHGGDGEAFI